MSENSGLQAAQTAFAAGRAEEGRKLLKIAAESGDANAQYSYAVALAYGQGGRIDREASARHLDAARHSVPAARQFYRYALAHGWMPNKGWPEAVADLIDAAANGESAALREAGLLCLLLGDKGNALILLDQAAMRDNAPAGMALLRLGEASDPGAAWVHAVRSGLDRSKHPLANELAGAELEQSTFSDSPDWSSIRGRLSDFEFEPVSPQTVIPDISAISFPGALPPAICDYVIASGLRGLQPSTIVDQSNGQRVRDPHRQSLSMTFAPHVQDLLHVAVERLMCVLAGCEPENSERLNLLLYRPGEEYRPHVDYFAPEDPGNAGQLTGSGQRVATSLICLHAADDGGETHFPRFDTVWRGVPGDSLSFRNVNSNGDVEPLSLHAGEPVLTGWKALASLWIRERPFQN